MPNKEIDKIIQFVKTKNETKRNEQIKDVIDIDAKLHSKSPAIKRRKSKKSASKCKKRKNKSCYRSKRRLKS